MIKKSSAGSTRVEYATNRCSKRTPSRSCTIIRPLSCQHMVRESRPFTLFQGPHVSRTTGFGLDFAGIVASRREPAPNTCVRPLHAMFGGSNACQPSNFYPRTHLLEWNVKSPALKGRPWTKPRPPREQTPHTHPAPTPFQLLDQRAGVCAVLQRHQEALSLLALPNAAQLAVRRQRRPTFRVAISVYVSAANLPSRGISVYALVGRRNSRRTSDDHKSILGGTLTTRILEAAMTNKGF